MLFEQTAQGKPVAMLIIEGDASHPKPVVIVFARCAVEVLLDYILARAFINEKSAYVGQHISAAPDLIGHAAMDANECRAVKIIRGSFAEHVHNVLGRYVNHFHPLAASIAVRADLSRDARDEMDINNLNQLRTATGW